MNWKYNGTDIIIFDYKDRKFEIWIDKDLSNDEIDNLVIERVNELNIDFDLYNSTDYSDLFVDKRKKANLENGDNL